MLRLFCLLLTVFPLHIAAQELLFSNLGKDVQLPSQECYKVVQDRNGYIWFSTDNGLCRYANGRISIFNEKNGLPEKNVYNIAEDPKGKLWVMTSTNRVLYYDASRNVMKEAPFSQDYKAFEKLRWKNATPSMLDVSDPDEFRMANPYYAVTVDRKSNRATFLEPGPSAEIYTAIFDKKEGHPLLPVFNISRAPFVISIRGDRKQEIKIPGLEDIYVNKEMPTALAGNADFIALYDKLMRVDSDGSISFFDFPDRIYILYTDPQDGLWVGIKGHGVYHYPDAASMQLAHHSLEGYSVSGVCTDHEGGVWCSTLEKGIFYCKNKQLISYAGTEGLDRTVSLLKFTRGKLFVSSTADKLYVASPKGLELHQLRIDPRYSALDIAWRENEWILGCDRFAARIDPSFRYKDHLSEINVDYLGIIQMASGNRKLYCIIHRDISEITSKKKITPVLRASPFTSNSVIWRNGELLMGGKQGVYAYNVATKKSTKIEAIPVDVRKMIKTRSGRIWIITKSDGIFWLDGEKVTHADKQLSLHNAVFFDIAEAPDGSVWAGASNGLYRFSQEGGSYKTKLYTVMHGLPSNEVYKVAADASRIWFSTFEGLFSLPLKTGSQNVAGPEIHMRDVTVHRHKLKHPAHVLKLSYRRSDLKFTFDVLTYTNGTETKLEYRLYNEDQNTVNTVNGDEILFSNLSPGNYTLEVYGLNGDGAKSQRPEKITIEIMPPFWMQWWFLVLMVLIFLTGTFLFARYIIRNIRRREEAKTLMNKLMAEYQITALQAQMNPHFIFNAINTIQGYILENSEQEAYDYLAKFSKLIRMVLHHSQEKMIPLTSELHVLKLYIELEQLRFDQCFDYRLELDGSIEPEYISLPSMLLQPYIENAIWHGLVNLRGSRMGHLVIRMEMSGELLKATITDNGVGREKAMDFRKNHSHKSVGMQLTGQRIEAITQLHGYETLNVVITDLFGEDQQPAGTKVEVWIPVMIET